MKLKWTVPYILTAASLFVGASMGTAQNEHEPNEVPSDFHAITHRHVVSYTALDSQMNNVFLDTKADSLCNKYVGNMLASQQKLHPLLGRSGYRAAVRAELPGAPVGLHCVYGQYTHLNRALNEMGDTLTIIPQGGHASCIGFKYHMGKKYGTPEFPNCIHDGVMYETDSAYNIALEKYLTRNKVNVDAPDSVRDELVKKFAARNFSADGLDAGSILIVPRYRGSRNKFHAIMYLGRGRIESGKFVPDSMGRHIYVGHNRENIGDLFKTYDTSKVFAADTRKIVRAEYANELKRIEAMPTQDLIASLADENATESMLATYPRSALVRMARDKYFNRFDIAEYKPVVAGMYSGISTTPMQLSKNLVQELKLNQRTL